eukprot:5890325-Pleurochrysis_carterae.AAC.1
MRGSRCLHAHPPVCRSSRSRALASVRAARASFASPPSRRARRARRPASASRTSSKLAKPRAGN